MQKNVNDALEEIREQEDKVFETNHDILTELASQYKLNCVWSVEEVPASQMRELMPFKINTIIYESWGETQKKVINKHLTWLEAWQLADEMIKLSGDSHHVFVECFDVDKKDSGLVHLGTGS